MKFPRLVPEIITDKLTDSHARQKYPTLLRGGIIIYIIIAIIIIFCAYLLSPMYGE